MTPAQIQGIPDHVLRQQDTRPLIDYLAARGLRLTLAELDAERRRRGITPPSRPRTRATRTTPKESA